LFRQRGLEIYLPHGKLSTQEERRTSFGDTAVFRDGGPQLQMADPPNGCGWPVNHKDDPIRSSTQHVMPSNDFLGTF
jgi:hypothetical protein